MKSENDIGFDRLAMVTAAAGIAAAPHLFHLPFWIALALPPFFAWGLWIRWKNRPLPRRWLINLLVVVAAGALLITMGGTPGRRGWIGLLVLMIGLKPLELKGKRDAMLILFLAYFLISVHSLNDQSIPTAAMMIGQAAVVTAAVVSLQTLGPLAPLAFLKQGGKLLAQAFPLALFFFLLFPRLPGPIWGLAADRGEGVSGLSGRLSPGTISRLVLSDAVAFRATFDGDPPPPQHRYWRAMVFDVTNGMSWWPSQSPREIPPIADREKTRVGGISYTLTVQPHGQRWLFALDHPTELLEGFRIRLNEQRLLAPRHPVHMLTRYRAHSIIGAFGAEPAEEERRHNLALPVGISTRIRDLVREWREAHPDDDEAVARAALDYFQSERFRYTLTPPALPDDPLDTFLFETRQGFCEHYASSFSILMRLAGIPARVVVGYLGGELNPLGEYYIIRQKEAHAWSEIWLEGKGWVRYDATNPITPERAAIGIDAVLPGMDLSPLLSEDERLQALRDAIRRGALARFLRNVRHTWDAVNNGWNDFVLGYGPKLQQQLMRLLGWRGSVRQGLLLFLGITTALTLLLLGFWLLRRPASADPAVRAWQKLNRKLARAGLPRPPHEGPLAYAARVSRQRPDLAPQLSELVSLYTRLRYSPSPSPDLLPLLRRRTRELKIS